ncbi:similar to transcription factor Zn, C2H2 [Botrytis cinerea T4]|uniref:Similar to transcription factor Zn, C2H2 n=1 Tax=Botryotinia fuckeliana (strain T4) TaxID=999810 RepID=G2Y0T3_BOTF4|nr:similar to transcription factor Zn, C2H2 [Botrytis cinerea T4]
MARTGAATLSEIGLQTIQLLKQVKTVKPPPGIAGEEWPRALFAAEADRFELWAVNLGVFISGHGSLDYRVREAESFERSLRRFMTDLNESLDEVLEYCVENRQSETQSESGTIDKPADEFQKSFDDDFDEDTIQNIDSDIDLLVDSVRDIIDRLYKLSTWIRNPSSRTGSTKAQTYQQIDQDSGVNLFDIFESFDYDYVSSLFSKYRARIDTQECICSNDTVSISTGESQIRPNHVPETVEIDQSYDKSKLSCDLESFLIRRIAHGNVRRRQQFAYWRKHRNKLAQQSSAEMRLFENSKEPISSQGRIEQQVDRVTAPIALLAQSITTASHLNTRQLEPFDNRSTASVSEYAPSSWQPGKEVLGFPDPPSREPGHKYFECPFCFTLCPISILAPKAWKAHIIRDLRPYICTYEDCKNPNQQYDTRQDWISHENSSHRNFDQYRDHLQTKHSNYATDETGNLMNKAGESTFISPDRCCPICLLSIETLKALQSHIALHLERFALFSLPRSIDRDDEVDEGDSGKVNRGVEGSRDGDFDLDSDLDWERDAEVLITDRPNVTTVIHGKKSDITDLDIDIQWLERLPEDIREDAIISAAAESFSKQQAKNRRKPVVHLLALEPMSEKELDNRIPGENDDLKQSLAKVADLNTSTGKWELRKNYYKELDVFSFRYGSDAERQKAIDNTIKVFDKMRLGLSEPEWEKLLPKSERGTGKSLSKIQTFHSR